MTQPVRMPLSEVADRYTIACLKLERLCDQAEDVEAMKFQVQYYLAGLDLGCEKLKALLDQLLEINGKMWDTEFEIRQCHEDALGLVEVGKRAIEIRNLNKQRIAIKNQIAALDEPRFRDVKMNYL